MFNTRLHWKIPPYAQYLATLTTSLRSSTCTSLRSISCYTKLCHSIFARFAQLCYAQPSAITLHSPSLQNSNTKNQVGTFIWSHIWVFVLLRMWHSFFDAKLVHALRMHRRHTLPLLLLLYCRTNSIIFSTAARKDPGNIICGPSNDQQWLRIQSLESWN